jgi:4-hydroxybenzoate polyprenyltransferase
MKLLRHLAGFLKLEHTLFSLPLLFAGAALGLAGDGRNLASLGWLRLAGIVLAGVGARTFALSLNRLMDRKIDAQNPRTSGRELPAKRLSLVQAWGIALLGFLIYIGAAAGLGFWPLVLSPLPLVVFTVYPLMKRFTSLSHFGVGTGLCLAPMGGYVGAVDRFPGRLDIWLLAAFTFFWVSGFDALYAIQDEKFDRKNKLFSIASRYGRAKAVQAGGLLHALAFISLLGLGFYFENGHPLFTWLALAPSGLALAAEQKLGGAFSLESNARFFQVNAWLGFLVLGFVLVGISKWQAG